MATARQKKLARVIVKNATLDKPLNAGELLERSGYSKSSSEASPGVIIEQKGVQEELEKLGFSEYSAKQVVQEIMLNPNVDPSARLKATDQVFKVQGSYAPEKSQSLSVNLEGTLGNADAEKLRQEYEDKLKLTYGAK